jgi:Ser/Thr protein kinase RdoA (MazF antagonist)
MEVHHIPALFGLTSEDCLISSIGNGLIHHTFLITEQQSGKKYILQKVNVSVFKNPQHIAENTLAIAGYLRRQAPDYVFMQPAPAKDGHYVVKDSAGNYLRMFPFAENTFTYQTPTSPALAFQAAAAFGKFTALLKGFPAESLHITLPDFHNLSLRYQSFAEACSTGNKERIDRTIETAKYLQALQPIEATYRSITQSPHFKKRVMHHDTKISNVLFDNAGHTVCLVDLDTVMPGYFISDVGDMMRNYLSAAGEEETDFSAINIRMDYFEALASGYLGQMGDLLTPEEKAHFVYSGKFITYMQALRFYTDYLQNDIYYPVTHPEHNLVRTQNQLVLLEKMMEKEREMEGFVGE